MGRGGDGCDAASRQNTRFTGGNADAKAGQDSLLKSCRFRLTSNRSIDRNRTSTCEMKRFAMRTPSRYARLLTWSSMSDMHAADDSSKAERTLQMRYTFSSVRSSSSFTASRPAPSSNEFSSALPSLDSLRRTFQNLWIM